MGISSKTFPLYILSLVLILNCNRQTIIKKKKNEEEEEEKLSLHKSILKYVFN